MAEATETTDLRPAPSPDGESERYWAAAKAHRFELPHCTACNAWIFPPRALCPSCWTEPEWKAPSGRGTVYTFSIMRDSFMKGFPPPYVVAETSSSTPSLRVGTSMCQSVPPPRRWDVSDW